MGPDGGGQLRHLLRPAGRDRRWLRPEPGGADQQPGPDRRHQRHFRAGRPGCDAVALQRRDSGAACRRPRCRRRWPVRHGAALLRRGAGYRIRRLLPQLPQPAAGIQRVRRIGRGAGPDQRHRHQPDPRCRCRHRGPPGRRRHRGQLQLFRRVPGRPPPVRPELLHHPVHRHGLEWRAQLPAERPGAAEHHRHPLRRPERHRPRRRCASVRQRLRARWPGRPGHPRLSPQGAHPVPDHPGAFLRPGDGRRAPDAGGGGRRGPHRWPGKHQRGALRARSGVRPRPVAEWHLPGPERQHPGQPERGKRQQVLRRRRLRHQHRLGLPRARHVGLQRRVRRHQPEAERGLVP
ncbi:hypothetical protein FQZ97_843930 [compost metagenome]